MYQPVRLQSGDLVRVSRNPHHPEKTYGILFFLKNQPFLLMADGVIEEGFSLESLEWVCHTALAHSSCFHSLEQVRQDFDAGSYAHVMDSVPFTSSRTMTNGNMAGSKT